MGIIPQHTVDLIYDTLRIEDIVSDYLQLRKQGTNFQGLCPFHNEKTPSFVVSPAKGIYKCFGCGVSGNAINFLMELDKLSYPDALRYVAKKYGILIEEEAVSEEQKELKRERESLQRTLDIAAAFFHTQCAPEANSIGKTYLLNRGITSESIAHFLVGYLPAGGQLLSKHLQSKGLALADAKTLGLLYQRGSSYFDRYEGRVIFPIRSVSGKVLGFGARKISEEDTSAKYINSPENELYHKSKVLYGMFEAKRAIGKAKRCIVTEGYTDVIALAQKGVGEVVASSGTALTQEQVYQIKRFTENITLLFDGDSAGTNAMEKAIGKCLEADMNIELLKLPEGDDPDSFAKVHTTEEIEEYIKEQSQTLQQFFLREIAKVEGQPLKRAERIRWVMLQLSKLSDPLKRTIYIQELSRATEISETVLFSELEQQLRLKQDAVEKERKRQERQATLQIHKDNTSETAQQEEKAPDGHHTLDQLKAMVAKDSKYRFEQETVRLCLLYGKTVVSVEDSEDETVPFFELALSYFEASQIGFHLPEHIELMNAMAQADHGDKEHNYLLEIFSKCSPLSQQYAIYLADKKGTLDQWEKKDVFVKTEDTVMELSLQQIIARFQIVVIKEEMAQLREQMIGKPIKEVTEIAREYMEREVYLRHVFGILGAKGAIGDLLNRF